MLFSNLLNQLLLKANCLKINSIKKASTTVKAFDTCERHRHYFELIFERFGGVVRLKRLYKLMNNYFCFQKHKNYFLMIK
jgi:hypothetical protein